MTEIVFTLLTHMETCSIMNKGFCLLQIQLMLEPNKDKTREKSAGQYDAMWVHSFCFAACIAVHSKQLLGHQVYVFCYARCTELNQRGPNRLN